MHNFRELKIWQSGIDLSKSVYESVKSFPDNERYGLTSQITRAAVSIPSQIAEGCSRKSQKEMTHFLSISLGSSYELETQLIIANKIHILNNETFKHLQNQCVEIQKMIYTFIQKINK